MRQWLEYPHVQKWWSSPDEQITRIGAHLDDPTVEPMMVEYGETAFAYIQICRLDGERVSEPALQDQPDGTVGIDQFIGPPELIGKGLGPRFMNIVCDRLFAEGVPRILVDPDPANNSAIRAYEKIGFKKLKKAMTKSGPALFMNLDRQEYEKQ
ncbi:acetyltransferase [Rhizobium sp. L1K21]|nr:acetyltransferase [Rhizobium sp. L1K21]